MPTRLPSPVLTTLTAATLLASGCRARQSTSGDPAMPSANVDTSWLIAAASCWPDLRESNRSLLDMKQFLGNPDHFRATFATYAALNDSSLASVAGTPVAQAPAPDASVLHGAQTPILTRTEAVRRRPEQALGAANTTTPPTDALCAIQHGTPVGFR